MSTATRHIRHGIGSVRPYLYGRLDTPELVKRAFGAVELECLPRRVIQGKLRPHLFLSLGAWSQRNVEPTVGSTFN